MLVGESQPKAERSGLGQHVRQVDREPDGLLKFVGVQPDWPPTLRSNPYPAEGQLPDRRHQQGADQLRSLGTQRATTQGHQQYFSLSKYGVQVKALALAEQQAEWCFEHECAQFVQDGTGDFAPISVAEPGIPGP